ncbi:hypothetical protein JCM8547_000849 [Rhodosporidiobolus lusitaniae]
MVLAAVGQLCSNGNVARNARLCTSIVRRAAAASAQLVSLPEASDFIAADPKEVPKLAQPLEGGEFVEAMRKAARENKVWVDVGVHEQGTEEKCYNTQLLISPDGNIAQAYRKVHLFDVPGSGLFESKTTIAGDEIQDPIETPVGQVGFLTCYDLRFPEAAAMLRRKGAHVLTYPSAFTSRTGPPHWEVLLRARAIETQCYVLAAAQVGENAPGRTTWGHAMIVDPWGTILAQVPDHGSPNAPSTEEGNDEGSFAIADIDLTWLGKIRKEMPLWDQRRNDIYPVV